MKAVAKRRMCRKLTTREDKTRLEKRFLVEIYRIILVYY